jgi:hypothetical protein
MAILTPMVKKKVGWLFSIETLINLGKKRFILRLKIIIIKLFMFSDVRNIFMLNILFLNDIAALMWFKKF